MQIINVFAPGHYDYMDSYGLIACRLLRHLTALGVHVNAMGLGLREVAGQPADITALATQPIRPAFGGIMLGYPTTYEKHGWMAQRGPRIALTMFESTKLPAEWAPILNTMDAVIVPSTFCHDTFRSAGITAPIRIVPLGVSEAYQPQPRTGDRPFTFLTFGDRGLRKGGLAAMNAFIAAFGDDCNYRLIIKARAPKAGKPRINILNSNIDMIQQDMTEAELYQLVDLGRHMQGSVAVCLSVHSDRPKDGGQRRLIRLRPHS